METLRPISPAELERLRACGDSDRRGRAAWTFRTDRRPRLRRLPPWQFDPEAARRALTPPVRNARSVGLRRRRAHRRHLRRRRAARIRAHHAGHGHRARNGLAVEHERAYVRMDPATRRNLELSETIRGEAAPDAASRSSTPARPAWAAACCAMRCTIRCATATVLEARHDAVARTGRRRARVRLIASCQLRSNARMSSASRLASHCRSARPRDLSGLRESLGAAARSRAQRSRACLALGSPSWRSPSSRSTSITSSCCKLRSRRSPAPSCAKAA